MPCHEFEDLILDYCEGAASPADGALLESHIAVCGGCRARLAMQQELDLRLSKSFPRPALSPAFAARLAARMEQQRHAPRLLWLPRILDGIGYLSLASAAGCLIQQLPHPGTWIGLAALAASAAFCLWETGKALRAAYGHR
jgi:anti-sigma factor RsiW